MNALNVFKKAGLADKVAFDWNSISPYLTSGLGGAALGGAGMGLASMMGGEDDGQGGTNHHYLRNILSGMALGGAAGVGYQGVKDKWFSGPETSDPMKKLQEQAAAKGEKLDMDPYGKNHFLGQRARDYGDKGTLFGLGSDSAAVNGAAAGMGLNAYRSHQARSFFKGKDGPASAEFLKKGPKEYMSQFDDPKSGPTIDKNMNVTFPPQGTKPSAPPFTTNQSALQHAAPMDSLANLTRGMNPTVKQRVLERMFNNNANLPDGVMNDYLTSTGLAKNPVGAQRMVDHLKELRKSTSGGYRSSHTAPTGNSTGRLARIKDFVGKAGRAGSTVGHNVAGTVFRNPLAGTNLGRYAKYGLVGAGANYAASKAVGAISDGYMGMKYSPEQLAVWNQGGVQ